MKRITFIVVALASTAAHAEVIYDNTIVRSGWWVFGQQPFEFADLIQLGGTSRSVQDMTLRLIFDTQSGGQGATTDVSFRIRAFDETTGLPGALLGSVDMLNLSHAGTGFLNLTANFGGLVVPDKIVIGAHFQRQVWPHSGGSIGLAFADPVAIGSSNSDQWFHNLGGTAWTEANGGPTLVGNMYAKITTTPVPEPATIAALAAGVGMLLRRRRKAL